MSFYSEIVSRAQFRADLQNSNRILPAEWGQLVGEVIDSTWNLAASSRPDFQVTSADFAVVSGASAAVTVPNNFHGLIDVVANPDTDAEYSLGPFAWQNRRAPGTWWPPQTVGFTNGATRARLMGNQVFLEPAQRAGGNYRLWYCPRPKKEYFVRLATAAGLPAVTPAGSGPTKTLTANANGALSVDGVPVAVGDRVLVNQTGTGVVSSDFGIYVVVIAGSAGTPFQLLRAADYNASSQIFVGDIAIPSEGTANVGVFFELTAFGGTIDVSGMSWQSPASIDAILNPFVELLVCGTAAAAKLRDDRDVSGPLTEKALLEDRLKTYFREIRAAAGPAKMVDTDARGPRVFPWGV